MADERWRIAYRVRYARAHPRRAVAHARRLLRNLAIRVRHPRDHTAFYREVMRHNVAADPDLAVGSASKDRWMALGQLQFDYLVEHGLQPHHRLLDIGCGNLRAGWRLIGHLDPGHYYGIDASPDVLIAAQRTIASFGLQERVPYLLPVGDLRFAALPTDHFDVVHAHSVFSHTPLSTLEECLRHVARVMRPTGFFDFTFNATSGREHHVAREDFYFDPERILDVARTHGFEAQIQEDWTSRHKQRKVRLRPTNRSD